MFAGGIAIRGNTAFIAFVDGLLVLDISNPADPQILANIGPTGSGAGESVTLKDNYAILAHQSYVEIYDVTVPSDPVQVSFFYPPGHPRKVLADGNHLYTILDDNGFLVTDITDPENPVQGPHINTSVWGSRQDVRVKDGKLYLCDWNRGLVIYDILPGGTVTQISEYASPGNLNDLTFDGNLAYLPCYTELQVLDIGDPSSPVFLGNYDTSGNPWGVTVRDNRAYLCDFYSFQILDVSNPADIRRLSALFLAQDGVPYRSVLNGNIAYVAYGWGGLLIIDISDPENPEVVKKWPEEGSVNYSTLHLEDGILYALNTSVGIDILDVSAPFNPRRIITYDHPDAVTADFHIQGDILYAAATTKGIFMVDISEPGDPVTVGRASTPGEAVGITAHDGYVYVADDFDLAVFQETGTDPDNIAPAITIDGPSPSAGIENKLAVIHGTASDGDAGVRYVELSWDGGNQWVKAAGQQSWSYSLSGVEPGPVTVLARAADWAGNVSATPAGRTFYFNVQAPRILMAGFMDSHLRQNQEETVTFALFLSDPFGINYVDSVDVYLDGEATGTTLELVTTASGIAFYQGEISTAFAQAEMVRYSFIAWDRYENASHIWPYLSVRP